MQIVLNQCQKLFLSSFKFPGISPCVSTRYVRYCVFLNPLRKKPKSKFFSRPRKIGRRRKETAFLSVVKERFCGVVRRFFSLSLNIRHNKANLGFGLFFPSFAAIELCRRWKKLQLETERERKLAGFCSNSCERDRKREASSINEHAASDYIHWSPLIRANHTV